MSGNRIAAACGGVRRRPRHRRAAVLLALAMFVGTAGLGASTSTAGAIDGRVIGGQPVADGGYRFQAALLDLSRGTNDYRRLFCGGSLIGRRHVLTAAHCADFISLSRLRVVVGRTVLSSSQGQKRLARRITVHPRWNPNTYNNDVAIIELAAPVDGIQPMRLAPAGATALERPGRLARVTGWGNTIRQVPGPPAEGSNYPDRMRVAQVPIVSDDDCAAAYRDFGGIVASTQICAGEPGRDTCQGDSGGPMFVAVSDGYRQIGITSYGIGCGARFPGVYTQISSPAIRNFIANATGTP